jgi:hypothetical protein
MAASCSTTVRPSAPGSSSSPAICCFKPATRIMKNSSRFELTIERNFSRSSSGTLLSAASSSTRWLNSSHESSRLMKSGLGALDVVVGGSELRTMDGYELRFEGRSAPSVISPTISRSDQSSPSSV